MPASAANAGYFLVLSVFPMLVLVLCALHNTALDAGDLLDLLAAFLPAALLEAAEKFVVSAYAYTSAAMASLSAVGALWSAGRGIYALIAGLNAVYGVQESRGYLYTRLLCAVYALVFLLLLLLTLILNVFGGGLLRLLPELGGALGNFLTNVVDLRALWMLLVQVGVITLLYTVLPNRKNTARESLPGAVVAALGWTLFSRGFSVYVTHFSGYANVYGSMYAAVLGMLWLYFCLIVLFFGGAVNALLLQRRL